MNWESDKVRLKYWFFERSTKNFEDDVLPLHISKYTNIIKLAKQER